MSKIKRITTFILVLTIFLCYFPVTAHAQSYGDRKNIGIKQAIPDGWMEIERNTANMSKTIQYVADAAYGTTVSISKLCKSALPSGWVITDSDATTKYAKCLNGASFRDEISISKSCYKDVFPSGWIMTNQDAARYYFKCYNGASFRDQLEIRKNCYFNYVPSGWIMTSQDGVSYYIQCLTGAYVNDLLVINRGVFTNPIPVGWTLSGGDTANYYIKCTVGETREAAKPVVEASPNVPIAGNQVTITYSSSNTSLKNKSKIKIHFGFDGWQLINDASMLSIGKNLWQVTINVPSSAQNKLDFEFTNGTIWDNNGGQDYGLNVTAAKSVTTNKVEFTPSIPIAGNQVTITYNGKNSPLNDLTNLKIHWGYDGWKHITNTDMVSKGDNLWQATITVPEKAVQKLDFAFTNGKLWDTNNNNNWSISIAKIQYSTTGTSTPGGSTSTGGTTTGGTTTNGDVVTVNPTAPAAGQSVTITYNAANGPLKISKYVLIHFGYDDWKSFQNVHMVSKGNGIWQVTLTVPAEAKNKINFEFYDGVLWDKNNDKEWSSTLQGATTTVKNPAVKVSIGKMCGVALLQDGTVRTWGSQGYIGTGDYEYYNVPVKPTVLTDVIDVATNNTCSLALKKDGTVWRWGASALGGEPQALEPVQVPGLVGVKALSVGTYGYAVLKNDGTVRSWGDNSQGEFGNGTTINSSTPVQAVGISGVKAISSGNMYTLALKEDGTVWAWGFNRWGTLGNGTTTNSSIPVQISALNGIKSISAGGWHNLALKEDGTVWSWGDNTFGELGNGTTVQSNVPRQVNGIVAAKEVYAGGCASLVLKEDGTVWAFGENDFGQLGDGTTIQRSIPVQTPLSGIKSISTSDKRSVAIKNDGTVIEWGNMFFKGIAVTTPEEVTGF